MLVAISSPHAKRGIVWEAYRRSYGLDDARTLVWKSDTATMNPSIDGAIIAAAYEADPAVAASEYGAEFRQDLEGFVSAEVLRACVAPGRHELPPIAGTQYYAFTDPSGGAQDSFALGIAHVEDERIVVDVVRERRAPFSPSDVVGEFAEVLKAYGISVVVGDRYAAEWPREQFAKCGIHYEPAASPKSDLYRELLPRLNQHAVELPDDARLLVQLGALERRVVRGGRDSIDHPPHGRDDCANTVAGVVAVAAQHGVVCVEPMLAGGTRMDWSQLGADGLPRTPTGYLSEFTSRWRNAF